MGKTMVLTALTALTVLTACDYVERSGFDRERADGLYKSAMGDYSAGRMDAAVDGFRRAVQKDPSNGSARFQLACLLQDVKADYLGAFCSYREFLMLHPNSDKARLAEDRLAKCERELAKALAEKHGLSDRGGFVKENAALKNDLRAAEVRAATAEKDAAALRARVTALGAERERLLAIVKGGALDGEAVVAQRPSVKEAKDLLEEDDEGDRGRISSDAASLRADADDAVAASSALLPPNTGTVARVAAKRDEPRRDVRQIPETHVVKEGETLYGLAKLYYGRVSAWKRIRDLNKHLISSDNRLHAGDTLKLPRE